MAQKGLGSLVHGVVFSILIFLASCTLERNNPNDPVSGNSNYAIHFYGMGVISNVGNVGNLFVHDDTAIYTVGVNPFNLVKFTFQGKTSNDILLSQNGILMNTTPQITVNGAANKVFVSSNNDYVLFNTNLGASGYTPYGQTIRALYLDNEIRLNIMEINQVRCVGLWGPTPFTGNGYGIGINFNGEFILSHSPSGGSGLIIQRLNRNTGNFISSKDYSTSNGSGPSSLKIGTETVTFLEKMVVYGNDCYFSSPGMSSPLIRVKNGTGDPEFVHLFPEVKGRVSSYYISGTGKLVMFVDNQLLIYKASGR